MFINIPFLALTPPTTPQFQFWYNHSPQYLGVSAAFILVLDLRDWSKEKQLAIAVLCQHLHRANNLMKHFADNKRSDRSFQVGNITLKKKSGGRLGLSASAG
jgi:hypothetical protein